MSRLQGLVITKTVFAFVVALTVVNAMGLPAATGVAVGAGGLQKSDLEQTNQGVGDFEGRAVGQSDPTFVGLAAAAGQTFNQLFTLATGTKGALESWGVPTVIAWGVQACIDLVLALALIQIVLRWKA